jgi:D-alanine--poly(phosphoribitol) ligase subunit 1
MALRFPDGFEVSYYLLNQDSNRIGHFLLKNEFRKGDVIAIFNEKSYLSYCLMLACLKTGIIYSNLDVGSPWPRIEKIIKTCEPKAVFFDDSNGNLIDNWIAYFPNIKLFDLNRELATEKMRFFVGENIKESELVNGADAAYIMFTSGSTGFPKGAVMSHNNVLNFIQWAISTFAVTADDIFTNVNPIYFDNSVFDFYTSIFSGATLIPLSHQLVKNASELVKVINKFNCTIWFSVPSLLVYLLTTKALSKGDFKKVNRISFGGEGFPKNKLKQLYDLFGDRMTFYNVYGPTECTCICSSYIIQMTDFESMNELAPLGNMAPNFGYHIIPINEKNLNLGELGLTGPGVGLGYYNDPERTSKSFVQNPEVKYSQIMYKTGDVVEKDKEGYIYFKGRIDNQIKHLGYRIELEEVEAAFSSLPYINEVGVIYEKLSADLGQIKAFVSVAEKNRDKQTILEDIKMLLPSYMVPRILKVLEVLPKNANGKIDRKQLSTL